MGQLWVWIDQDLCTGDGLCTDHCPEVFRLLDDGVSYVVDPAGAVHHTPGGATEPAAVLACHADAVVAAATDCPGECIFLEDHLSAPHARVTSPDPPDDGETGAEDPADVPSLPAVDGRWRWPRRVEVRWRHSDGSTVIATDGADP